MRVRLKSGQDEGIKEQSGSGQKMWRSSDLSRAQPSGVRITFCIVPDGLKGTDNLGGVKPKGCR